MRKLLFVGLAMSVLGFQCALADFYVIPVGSSSHINSSDVITVHSECVSAAAGEYTLFTVPAGKKFVVKQVSANHCIDLDTSDLGRGYVSLGNYRYVFDINSSVPIHHDRTFPLGIVLNSGATIKAKIPSDMSQGFPQGWGTGTFYIVVNGYYTN